MHLLRQIPVLICTLLGTMIASAHSQHISDSLLQVLSTTTEARQRIQLLLNLKDLNEGASSEVPYSIQLFREAAAVKNTYAMSVAIVPIIERYATYPERADSLTHYIDMLRQLTPGTPEEGFTEYAEMAVDYYRMFKADNLQAVLPLAQKIIRDYHIAAPAPTIYARTKASLLQAYAKIVAAFFEKNILRAYATQVAELQAAYDLTQQMPDMNVRTAFATLIYYPLSISINQVKNFPQQQDLISDYTALLDRNYADSTLHSRRPYFYGYHRYNVPYQQLMLAAHLSPHPELADQYFQEFRNRMLHSSPRDLMRNKSQIYEIGYLWFGTIGNPQVGINYCDSLIRLTAAAPENFGINAKKMIDIRRNYSRLLFMTQHYDQSYEAFAQTSESLDSLFVAESHERAQTIRRHHDMNKLKLAQTRAIIRNRMLVTGSFIGIGFVLIGIGFYFYRMLRHNKRLQTDILRHSRKALESEHMKSVFVNTICRGIEPPLDLISHSAQELTNAGFDSPKLYSNLEQIRQSTRQLLSTLDNMIEASNLDSLSDKLHLEDVDIDEVCSAELIQASRLHENSGVGYIIESPGTHCTVQTHAKYFSFVVRALLDNAGKFTQSGTITLRYELSPQENLLYVLVTDTGCGIPPERQEQIFRPMNEHTPSSHGLSLSLCKLIAEHLSGTIRLDGSYTQGARFIFTIPAKP